MCGDPNPVTSLIRRNEDRASTVTAPAPALTATMTRRSAAMYSGSAGSGTPRMTRPERRFTSTSRFSLSAATIASGLGSARGRVAGVGGVTARAATTLVATPDLPACRAAEPQPVSDSTGTQTASASTARVVSSRAMLRTSTLRVECPERSPSVARDWISGRE